MAAAGSVEDVVARLESWCLRAPKGFARVEFESAYARRAVLHRLRPKLSAQHLPLREIELQSNSPSSLADRLIRSLRCWESGVISISGFEAALALSAAIGEADPTRTDAFSPADALQGLNFHREELARPAIRQIWWMTPWFAELLVRAAPDLDSWFMVRVRVTENVPAPAEEEGMIQGDGRRRGAITDARQRALVLVDRFRRGLEAGEPLDDLERSYALRALIALQAAGATSEALRLAGSMAKAIRRSQVARGENADRSSDEKTFTEETAAGAAAGNGETDYEAAEGFYRRAVERAARFEGSNPSDLAASLTNLGNFYSDLGRREEALRAAVRASEIDQQLAAQNPDAFEPDLAGSLSNLGNRYGALGRREEALQAAERASEIYQRLAAQNPDAFEPDLAGSLNNLGRSYSALGRWEESLQAVERASEIYLRLAGQNPDAFESDLAMSLSNLGSSYSVLGRREEALRAVEQAVEIRERLAAQNPDAFEPDLATSLYNLGIVYNDLERRGEALGAAERAAEIRERLARQNPDAFEPDLAASLHNLGRSYGTLGRWEDALRASERAVEIRERLATQNPDAFAPDLALSLGSLGRILSGDHPRRAAATFKRGIETLHRLFLENPQAFQGLMGALVRDYLRASERIGDEPDAALLAPIQEAMHLLDPGQSE